MNNVVLTGRLARDPELIYLQNEKHTAKTRFTLAINREGQRDVADFVPIIVFGKQAENCNQYLGKGSLVAVNGRIQTGSYKNRDGQTVYTTDVFANNVEFLGTKVASGDQTQAKEQPQTAPQPAEPPVTDGYEAIEEDIPF
jgi:single-strand binding protein